MSPGDLQSITLHTFSAVTLYAYKVKCNPPPLLMYLYNYLFPTTFPHYVRLHLLFLNFCPKPDLIFVKFCSNYDWMLGWFLAIISGVLFTANNFFVKYLDLDPLEILLVRYKMSQILALLFNFYEPIEWGKGILVFMYGLKIDFTSSHYLWEF